MGVFAMSATGRIYLVASDELHAETLDAIVFSTLEDKSGTRGIEWSGVWTDGGRFGILWDSPAHAVFGDPEENSELILVEEDDAEPWTKVIAT